MKVLLLSRYAARGASSRVRMYQFLPGLHDAGIEVTAAPLMDDALLAARYASGRYARAQLLSAYARRASWLLRSRQFDLVWIEYELFPWLPALAELVLGRVGPPYVVEYDDAVFHRYDRHPRRAVRALLGRKIDRVMRRAATVIAGNAYLVERAQRAGARRIVEIPTVVDIEVYRPGPPPIGAPAVIGWIGSPTTAPYLRLVEPVLADLVTDGRARVTLVGVEPGAIRWAFPCEEHRWTEAREVAEVQAFDIGIMPLPDEPWERGKCGYKLIQYMACGRPVVASPVGANRDIVRHGVNGWLAATAEEWRRGLGSLVDDPAGRVRMGLEGRTRVERHYARHSVLPRLIDALSTAAGSSTRTAT